MSLSITQKINDFEDADFKLSLAKGTPKNSYLASGADYYVPQNPQVASKADKNSNEDKLQDQLINDDELFDI